MARKPVANGMDLSLINSEAGELDIRKPRLRPRYLRGELFLAGL